MTIETTLSEILSELRTITKALAGSASAQLSLPLSAPATQATIPPAETIMPPPTVAFGSATTVAPSVSTVPVAPLIPPPPSPPNPGASSASTDVRGFPWDGRIHASSKAKVADGSWRAKRGVDINLVRQVESELSQALAAPQSAQAPVVNEHTPYVLDFTRLVTKLSELMARGDVTQVQLNAACAAHGVPNTAALASRPDLVASVAAMLGIA